MPRLASITSSSLVGLNIARGSIEASYDNLVLNSLTYNEGNTITATLITSGVDNDVTVPYTVTGISANDIDSGSLSGSFTIVSNRATATWTISQDGITEGSDTFLITLNASDSNGDGTGELSASATILDTSNDPQASPFLDDNDDIVTVASIIGQFSLQLNGVFAASPLTPFDIVGRTSGAETTVTNITANTGTLIEVDDNGNSTSFVQGEEVNLVVLDLTITPAADNVNEGSNLLIQVASSDIDNGTELYWTVTSPAEFAVSSGSFTINNNSAIIEISPTADATTEGAETFTFNIRTGSITGPIVATSGAITINDTSVPTYDTFTLDATNYDEGDTVTVDVTTTNIPENTQVTYDITGVQSADVSKTSGTITIGADGTGSDTFTTTTGGGLEGTETITVTLRATDASGNATGSLSDSATLVEPITASVTAASDTVTAGNSINFTANTDNYPTGYQATYRVVNGTTNSSDFSGGSGFYNTGTQSGIFNTAFGGNVTITLNTAADADATNETFQVEVLKPDSTRAGISDTVTIIPAPDYSLTVINSGASAYEFLMGDDANGSVSGNNPSLTFNAGDIVEFVVDASGHPFWIKTAPTTGTGDAASGVVNNGDDLGTVRWTIPSAGTYYYQCQFHGAMNGTITVNA